jgi:hypothetical protein
MERSLSPPPTLPVCPTSRACAPVAARPARPLFSRRVPSFEAMGDLAANILSCATGASGGTAGRNQKGRGGGFAQRVAQGLLET